MGFEELAGVRIRRQHSLDPLAQVRVLATPLGEVRGPLVGREFAGSIEDFFFPISVGAHLTKGASTRDHAFSHSKRSTKCPSCRGCLICGIVAFLRRKITREGVNKKLLGERERSAQIPPRTP